MTFEQERVRGGSRDPSRHAVLIRHEEVVAHYLTLEPPCEIRGHREVVLVEGILDRGEGVRLGQVDVAVAELRPGECLATQLVALRIDVVEVCRGCVDSEDERVHVPARFDGPQHHFERLSGIVESRRVVSPFVAHVPRAGAEPGRQHISEFVVDFGPQPDGLVERRCPDREELVLLEGEVGRPLDHVEVRYLEVLAVHLGDSGNPSMQRQARSIGGSPQDSQGGTSRRVRPEGGHPPSAIALYERPVERALVPDVPPRHGGADPGLDRLHGGPDALPAEPIPPVPTFYRFVPAGRASNRDVRPPREATFRLDRHLERRFDRQSRISRARMARISNSLS